MEKIRIIIEEGSVTRVDTSGHPNFPDPVVSGRLQTHIVCTNTQEAKQEALREAGFTPDFWTGQMTHSTKTFTEQAQKPREIQGLW